MTPAVLTALPTANESSQAEPLGVSIHRGAAMLNVHPNTLRRRLKDGTVKHFRVGSRVLVNLKSLKELASGEK